MRARLQSDQYIRLKLLKFVPRLLRNSHTLQEYSEKKQFERLKINSRWEKRLSTVRYYAFVGIVDGFRIKVIIKQVNDDSPYFWSVIPYWKNVSVAGFEQKQKSLSVGDLSVE